MQALISARWATLTKSEELKSTNEAQKHERGIKEVVVEKSANVSFGGAFRIFVSRKCEWSFARVQNNSSRHRNDFRRLSITVAAAWAFINTKNEFLLAKHDGVAPLLKLGTNLAQG